MPEKLPKGWVKTTLGEIAEPSRERALPMEFPGLRYVGLEHIEPHSMRLLEHGDTRKARSSSVRFSTGDVLYGKMRPYLNKVWVAEFDGLCSAEFLVFPKREGLNSWFLALRLNAEGFVTFANGQVSGERPRVDFEKLSRFPILLPPLAEQERIVAKAKAGLSGVDRAVTASGRARERLKRYRAAVLRSAVTGDLTAAWREAHREDEENKSETGEALLRFLLATPRARRKYSESKQQPLFSDELSDNKGESGYREPAPRSSHPLPKLPQGWISAAVGQLGEVKLGRQRSPKHHTGKYMRPYLRVANVFENRIDISDVMRMNFTPREFEIYRLEEGDILLNEGQSLELVGRPAMYRNEISNCCFQNTLVRFRVYKAMNAHYALIVFRSYLHNGQFRRIAKITTNLAHLGANRFAKLEFPLPSAGEQVEIVREVESRLTAADRLAARLDRQLERARATRQSLLREAFAGRLLSQDPNDEPASLLLKRIRAAREVEAQKPKGERMPKSKAKSTGRRNLLAVLEESAGPVTPEQLFRVAGFEPSQVDQFYRELTLLRDKVREQKPKASEAMSWPLRAHVFLQLKKRAAK